MTTPYVSSMNQAIQSQLDRIDASLTTLIDSIASYNPSIPAAQDLLSADDKLNDGVKQLVVHQRNHARIASLRNEIDTLNAVITSKLTSLANLRSEILAQKITPVPDIARQVPYRELLDYAQRISRYTVPPVAVQYLSANKPSDSTKERKEEANGITGQSEDTVDAGKEAESKEPTMVVLGGIVPWPSEEVIKRGALGNIQSLVEQGADPAAIKVKGQENVDEASKEVTREEKPAADVGLRESAPRPQEIVGMPRDMPRVEKPKVFGGLDLYDPDED